MGKKKKWIQDILLSWFLLWATEDTLECFSEASTLFGPVPPRSRCQDRIRCARDITGEAPVRENGPAAERRGEHQTAVQVWPHRQAREQAGTVVSGRVSDCTALPGVLSKADRESLSSRHPSELSCVSQEWPCPSVPAQLSTSWKQATGSTVSAQEW